MKQAIVAAARGWLGTRWQHQGRLRGVGVDCVGLVLGVVRECGCLAESELGQLATTVGGYGRQPDGRLLPLCRALLVEVPLDLEQPGDLLVLRFEREPQHLAIVGDCAGARTLIHACAQARRVVEHRINDVWRARRVAAFTLPGAV